MKSLIYILIINVVLSDPIKDVNTSSNNTKTKTGSNQKFNADSTPSSNSSKFAFESKEKKGRKTNEVIEIHIEEAVKNIKIANINTSEASATAAFLIIECPTGYARADNEECVPIEQ